MIRMDAYWTGHPDPTSPARAISPTGEPRSCMLAATSAFRSSVSYQRPSCPPSAIQATKPFRRFPGMSVLGDDPLPGGDELQPGQVADLGGGQSVEKWRRG